MSEPDEGRGGKRNPWVADEEVEDGGDEGRTDGRVVRGGSRHPAACRRQPPKIDAQGDFIFDFDFDLIFIFHMLITTLT